MRRQRSFLTVSDVARRANVAPDTVRAAERRGDLPGIRTQGGVRLFDELDVQRWIVRRAAAEAQRAAARGDAA